MTEDQTTIEKRMRRFEALVARLNKRLDDAELRDAVTKKIIEGIREELREIRPGS